MPRNIQGTDDQRKALRVTLLTSCDWYTWRQRDQIDAGEPTSLSQTQWTELLAYRQALRDWPASSYQDPFPPKPEWMQ